MRRFALILAAVVAVAAAGLFLRDAEGMAEVLKVAALVVVLVAVGLGLWSEGTFGRAVRHSLAWLAAVAILMAGYNYREQIEWNARRFFAELTPAVASLEASGDKVILSRAAGGQFRVPATVNDRQLTMLVDTGASVVTLTHDDALAAGIPLEKLNYSVTIYTANGRTTAAPVILDRLAVGTIQRRRVPALVAHAGVLERSLLGLSFLDTLGGYAIKGDRLEFTP